MVNTGNNSSRKRVALDDPRDCGSRVVHASPSASDDASSVDNTRILMTQRENDFNDKTWWMVDINPVGGKDISSRQGATPLVKRCMRTYGWDELKTRKVLNAYRQFITLKKEAQDWDAKILSPCYLVDQMWHSHILDVVNYCHDMMLMCGRVLGHDPDGALDNAAKQQRDETTRKLLKERFESYDEDVWNYSLGQNNEASGEEKSTGPVDEENDKEETGAEAITFRLRFEGEVTIFKMKSTIKMQRLFSAFKAEKGINERLNFLLYGEPIHEEHTPETLGLKDNDEIDVFYGLGGC